ncbi:hypothetical protein [Salmonella enterica]|uniref:hypothetical protein n=1 Tax=Salmonella enterica TaxID=28901 RepID=UPI0035BE8BA6
MKLLRLVSLVSSVVIGFSLSGCAGDTGTTPGTALNAYSHGQYWHAKANDSVAKNDYSFAGFDVNFKEQEVTPGGDADNFLSKYLINSSMGYVTGGLKGFGRAAKNGGATGENVKKAFYQKKDWVPAGMEGVCNPSTWTEKDHRPTLKVDIYRMKVSGATDASVADLVKAGTIKLDKVKTVDLPRKQEFPLLTEKA